MSATAMLAGALFALGLAISGMTEPGRVLAFLDVAGDWDSTLAFVMVGAIAVYAPLYRFITCRLTRPVLADAFHVPPPRKPDARLLLGAALFGVGWGLAGLCPGPALVALGAGKREALVFACAMVLGSLVTTLVLRPRRITPRGHGSRRTNPLAHDDV